MHGPKKQKTDLRCYKAN